MRPKPWDLPINLGLVFRGQVTGVVSMLLRYGTGYRGPAWQNRSGALMLTDADAVSLKLDDLHDRLGCGLGVAGH
jgi:hypothetical protein